MLSDKAMRESPLLVHPASAPTEQPPPETLRHQDRLAGRSGERRDTASTEGDIRAARRGL